MIKYTTANHLLYDLPVYKTIFFPIDYAMKISALSKLQLLSYLVVALIAFAIGYYVASNDRHIASNVRSTINEDDTDHMFGKINMMKQSSDAHENQDSSARSLGDLVAGLEKKVAANPENIDQQLLLAQTYNELNQREKSISLLNKLNKQAGKNAQVKIVYATVLMKSDNTQDLKLAYQLFEEAIKLKPDVESMAKMYMGEINVKLKR